MADLDRLIATLGSEGEYGEAAADRLAEQLRRTRSPQRQARRDLALVSVACLGLACTAGAVLGAFAEARSIAGGLVLPAEAASTPAALLFGEG